MQKHIAIPLIWTAATVVVLIWFTSIMVDCDHFLSQACDKAIYASWIDLWRLKWVANYKEIIAGCVAAAAGWSAIYAVRLQIEANRKAELQRFAQQVRSALSLISADFDRAIMTFSRTANERTADMKIALAALPTISQAHPVFAGILTTAMHAVELGLIEALTAARNESHKRKTSPSTDWTWRPDTSDPVDEATIRDGWFHAAAVRSYVAGGGAVVQPDGSIVLNRVSAYRYRELAAKLGIAEGELPLRDLFDWS